MAKRGGVPKRTKGQRLEDFNFITPLLIQGLGFGAIAQRLTEARQSGRDYNYHDVYGDAKEIMKQWQAERVGMMDHQKNLEIKKLDRLESIYYEAWIASTQARVKTVTKRRGAPATAQVTGGALVVRTNQTQEETHTQESVGNVQFLQGMERCIAQRCALMGWKAGGGGGEGAIPPAPVDRDIVFKTRPRNERYADAIEITPDEDEPNNIPNKKLLL